MVADLNGVIFSLIYGDNSGGAEFDTDGDGTATQEDEFVSLQNTTGSAIDLSGWQIWSDMTGAGAPDGVQDGLYHTFPSGTIIQPGKNLYIVNEISGTPPSNMQEASEGGVESGSGGQNTNFLTEGSDENDSEGVALVNPATGEYIVINLSENAASNFPGMSGFPGTTLIETTNAAVESGQEDQNAGSSYRYNSATDSYEYSTVSVVYFATGTMIVVPEGERRVEELEKGDLVVTLDHGVQRLQKSLRRHLNFLKGDDPCHKPIEFKPDALGFGVPRKRLVVSPQHRMLVQNPEGDQVLVPAKALTEREGIRVMKGCRKVSYVHLVFARHEIVKAHGCWSESFYPGTYVTSRIKRREQLNLIGIFPELMRDQPVSPARSFVRVGEAQKIAPRDCILIPDPEWAGHMAIIACPSTQRKRGKRPLKFCVLRFLRRNFYHHFTCRLARTQKLHSICCLFKWKQMTHMRLQLALFIPIKEFA
jgi:hypothetical protein